MKTFKDLEESLRRNRRTDSSSREAHALAFEMLNGLYGNPALFDWVNGAPSSGVRSLLGIPESGLRAEAWRLLKEAKNTML